MPPAALLSEDPKEQQRQTAQGRDKTYDPRCPTSLAGWVDTQGYSDLDVLLVSRGFDPFPPVWGEGWDGGKGLRHRNCHGMKALSTPTLALPLSGGGDRKAVGKNLPQKGE